MHIDRSASDPLRTRQVHDRTATDRMARTLASLLIGIGLTVPMAVQPHGAEPDGLLSGYTLTSWATRDGLPGTVRAIVQTDDGYLWLGTANGLVRFDGVRFVPWAALGATPLPEAGIRALLLAHDGALWAGFDNAAGVSRLRDGQAQAFTEADGIALGSVTALAQDRRHTIWAASTAGLFSFDGERWRKLGTRQGFAAEAALSLFVGEAGALFVGTDNGVFRLGEDTERFDPVTTGRPEVLGLSEDETGTIWTTDPVVGFAPLGEDVTTDRTRVPGRGSRVLHDGRGNLWVGTLGQGLWRVRPAADAPIEPGQRRDRPSEQPCSSPPGGSRGQYLGRYLRRTESTDAPSRDPGDDARTHHGGRRDAGRKRLGRHDRGVDRVLRAERGAGTRRQAPPPSGRHGTCSRCRGRGLGGDQRRTVSCQRHARRARPAAAGDASEPRRVSGVGPSRRTVDLRFRSGSVPLAAAGGSIRSTPGRTSDAPRSGSPVRIATGVCGSAAPDRRSS